MRDIKTPSRCWMNKVKALPVSQVVLLRYISHSIQRRKNTSNKYTVADVEDYIKYEQYQDLSAYVDQNRKVISGATTAW